MLERSDSSHHGTRLVSGAVLLFFWTAATSDTALAAELAVDSDLPGGLGEVIVTARRRAENAQGVPIPITTVSGPSLEQAGEFRLEDLNGRLPSLNVEFANPRQTSIAVRGIGNNPANDGLESSVGIYLDDVYLGRPGMVNQDLIDVGQISLLRGPQGTLFGKNTTAGVLNLSSRVPCFTTEGILETSVGNDSYYQVRGTLSGPINDIVAGRISYAKTSRDGFIDDLIDGRRLNGVNREGFRGQLLLKPREDLLLRLIGDYESENSPCCVTVLANLGPDGDSLLKGRLAAAGAAEVYDPDFLSTTINDPQHVRERQGGASIHADWQFSGGYVLTSITAYRAWRYLPTNDADNTSVSASENVGQAVRDGQWSQEIRIASPSARAMQWVLGIYYFYQDQSNWAFTQYGPAAQALDNLPQYYNNAYSQVRSYPKTNSYAAFAQSTWQPSDEWTLTAGLRDTQEQKESKIIRDAPIGAPDIELALPAYSSGDLRIGGNNVSSLLSLGYQLDPARLIYLSASHGAKAGGINETVPASGLPTSSLFVKPESATDYELGIKSTGLNRRLLLNINLFWTEVKDYQATRLEQSTLGLFVPTLSNIGGVRTRGLEAELVASARDWFTFDLNASYNRATYSSYVNAPCSVESSNMGAAMCILTGQAVVGAPKWIMNPDLAMSRFLGGGVSAHAHLGYAWRSTYFGTPDNSKYGVVAGYGLLNLRLGLSGNVGSNKWEFALWASNALDKHYLVGGLGGPTFGTYSLYPGAPRFWGTSISVAF